MCQRLSWIVAGKWSRCYASNPRKFGDGLENQRDNLRRFRAERVHEDIMPFAKSFVRQGSDAELEEDDWDAALATMGLQPGFARTDPRWTICGASSYNRPNSGLWIQSRPSLRFNYMSTIWFRPSGFRESIWKITRDTDLDLHLCKQIACWSRSSDRSLDKGYGDQKVQKTMTF